MTTEERAAKIRQFQRLCNVRFSQSHQRAAATQRKIEALYRELRAAGVPDKDMS